MLSINSCKKNNITPEVIETTQTTILDTNYNTVGVSYSCPTGSIMTYLVDGIKVNAPNNRIEVLRGAIFKLVLVKPYTDNSKQLSFTLIAISNK